ncbi:hypothetical protein AURDEDRAFT_128955 [Auricularia subglabra TFB-10046 SS5]|nr:hypothetical protein AURDEDRAFT_128955 [Auricularia subglabra TFB-10046 SS5]
MSPKSEGLCPAHRDWANCKLRSLVDAHNEDARRGTGTQRYSELVDQYMEDYEQQPFAKSTFSEYLDDNGQPKNAKWTDSSLRGKARRYFHNHSDPAKMATLESFERLGGKSETGWSRVKSASELWAHTEKTRICELTRAALDRDAPHHSKAWLGARKSVVRQEFAMLAEDIQAQWKQVADENKEVARAKAAQATAVQRRLDQFHGDLSAWVNKRAARGALGEHFLFTFQGCYVGPETWRLTRFRGQRDTCRASKWFHSPAYTSMASKWTGFIEPIMQGFTCSDVLELPDGAVGAELVPYRHHLREHFERLFQLASGLEEQLDGQEFWASVHGDPDQYVDHARLPAGTGFRNPDVMPEHDFVLIYNHMYTCYWNPETIKDDKHFVYEDAALQEAAELDRGRQLKAALEAKVAQVSGPQPSNPNTGTTSSPASGAIDEAMNDTPNPDTSDSISVDRAAVLDRPALERLPACWATVQVEARALAAARVRALAEVRALEVRALEVRALAGVQVRALAAVQALEEVWALGAVQAPEEVRALAVVQALTVDHTAAVARADQGATALVQPQGSTPAVDEVHDATPLVNETSAPQASRSARSTPVNGHEGSPHSSPPGNLKRKTPPLDDDIDPATLPSMAADGYRTRNRDTRRAPPSKAKKRKTVEKAAA